MNKPDQLHPFLFENTAIRGNIANLNDSYQEALAHQQSLPPVLKKALGELMAATALLIATLKMDGALILQLQGKGKLKLLVVECTSDLNIRATAKVEGDIGDDSFLDLVAGGQFVITLTQKEGEPYQGIVALEGDSIAEMLQNYMLRSQQIDTSLWLFSDDTHATGMLIQKLPNHGGNSQESNVEDEANMWNHVNQLTNTITHEELSSLSAETVLQRLFHEEAVRLFDARAIQAQCSCSPEHVGNMLTLVGKAEVDSIIEEQGSVQINCDFCNKLYVFDEAEIAEIFSPSTLEKDQQPKH